MLWSDETSVIYGQRRGGEKVWRTIYERNEASCRRNRWKGFSEFMFWGCFSYDYKGPCHVWTAETATEKKKATTELARRNAVIEEDCRSEWELNTGFRRRLNLREAKAKGKEPIWQFNEANGKLIRKSKSGGIDWYRYSEDILKRKLIPFAEAYNLIAMEDGAAPHMHKECQKVYNLSLVRKLLWPGNSPDLNMIEPCWYWMKRSTILHRDFESRPRLREIWVEQWQKLEQSKIQAWVQRIVRHIKEVIRLAG